MECGAVGYRVRDNTRIGSDRNDNGDSLDPNAGLNVDEPAELEPTDAAPVSDEPAPRPQLVQPEPPVYVGRRLDRGR